MLFSMSDNEFLGTIYRLFGGRQNIFITIFNTKFVVNCAAKKKKKNENRLTKTKVMSKNIFEQGIFYRKIARRGSTCNYFPGKFKIS